MNIRMISKPLKIVQYMRIMFVMLMFVFMQVTVVFAQSHEFSVYGGGGLSALHYKLSTGDASGGFGGDFGLGYTFSPSKSQIIETGTLSRRKWGIFAGIGLGLYNAQAKLNNVQTVTSGLSDGELHYDRFDLRTTFTGYNEKQNAMLLNIPVMWHFQMAQFYVMAGVKAGIPLNGKYQSKDATLTNKAYYPDLGNEIDAPEFRGYGTFRGKNSDGVIDLGLSVALSLEAGINRRIGGNIHLYAGVYVDYGLNNVVKSSHQPFVNYTGDNPANFTTNSVLSSYSDYNNYNNKASITFTDKANIMAVGIKVRLAYVK